MTKFKHFADNFLSKTNNKKLFDQPSCINSPQSPNANDRGEQLTLESSLRLISQILPNDTVSKTTE